MRFRLPLSAAPALPAYALAALAVAVAPPEAARIADAAPPTATAAPSGDGGSDLVLVLDASGSMWGKVRGEPKIAIARRVLKDVLARVPAGTRVGLVAYGHRSKDDCADIETIAAPGALDRARLAERIAALDARGKTPIRATVERVIEEARKSDRPATIVLVSDGIETCGGDACALVRAARAAGVRFVLHVVGFDLEKTDVAQLECVAQAGGGLYLPANDATQLTAALTQAVALTPETPAGRLSLAARADGKPTDALVRVFRAGEKTPLTAVRTYEGKETNPRLIPLPDGTYDVTVEGVGIDGRPRRELSGIAIANGETVERVVDFGTGTLAVRVTRNGKLSDATVSVREAGGKAVVASGRTYTSAAHNPLELRLPTGSYDVEVASVEVAGRPSTRWDAVLIEGGATIERAHDFSTSTIAIGARRGGELVDAVVEVVPAGATQALAQGRTYTSAQSNPKSFEVPPGRYVVRVKPVKPPGLAAQQLEVEVPAGERVERFAELAPAP